MGKKDPRVDDYIRKSAPFARPILQHLRAVVHEACPDCVEEIKWSFPHFTYKGMLASMASFKEHCAFGFWKGALVVGEAAKDGKAAEAMGQLGRITALSDLPSKATLIKWTRKAAALNDQGIKAIREKTPKPAFAVPADLTAALKKNNKARTVFAAFAPSKQRDYVEWITEAKTDATRSKRLTTAVEWLAEGKSRNWKYER
jgi:uncharacterized protein YdeI (YjbR/CyaY-like superfamily)